MRKLSLHAAAVCAVLGTLGGAHPAANATTATSTFDVTISITSTCMIASAPTLAFGSHAALTAPIDQTAALQVRCTNTTPYDIGLDRGVWGDSVMTRRMKSATTGAMIGYVLYSDRGRTRNWGDRTGVDTVHDTGDGAVQTHLIHGRVPPQPTPAPAADYSDTITITVTF